MAIRTRSRLVGAINATIVVAWTAQPQCGQVNLFSLAGQNMIPGSFRRTHKLLCFSALAAVLPVASEQEMIPKDVPSHWEEPVRPSETDMLAEDPLVLTVRPFSRPAPHWIDTHRPRLRIPPDICVDCGLAR